MYSIPKLYYYIFIWLKKSNIHPETEGFIFAIQDRVILVNTRNYKKHMRFTIDH
jgi:hypothetical protein